MKCLYVMALVAVVSALFACVQLILLICAPFCNAVMFACISSHSRSLEIENFDHNGKRCKVLPQTYD